MTAKPKASVQTHAPMEPPKVVASVVIPLDVPVQTANPPAIYDAMQFAYGCFGGPSALMLGTGGGPGSTAVSVVNNFIIVPGLGKVVPFDVTAPVTFGVGLGTVGTRAPTAVSPGSSQVRNSCFITAVFTNRHNPGELIASGTFGLQEAINYANAHGGGSVNCTPTWFAAGGTAAMISGVYNPGGITINQPSGSSSGSGMMNPMTTLGDMIDGAASGTPQRLGVGSTGQVLTVVSGAPAWAAAGAAGPAYPAGTLGSIKQGANTLVASDGTIGAQSVTRSVTANSTLAITDSFVDLPISAGTITMPTGPLAGQRIVISNRNANTVTLQAQVGASFVTISGLNWSTATSVVLSGNGVVEFMWVSTSSLWVPIGSAFTQNWGSGVTAGMYGVLQPGTATAIGGVKAGNNTAIDAAGALNIGNAASIALTSGSLYFQNGLNWWRFYCNVGANKFEIDVSTTGGAPWTPVFQCDITGNINIIAGLLQFFCPASVPTLSNSQASFFLSGTSPNVALNAAWQDASGIAYQAAVGLKPATATVIGGVKQGTGMVIAADGTISIYAAYFNWTPTVTTTPAGVTANGSVIFAQYNNMGAQTFINLQYQVDVTTNTMTAITFTLGGNGAKTSQYVPVFLQTSPTGPAAQMVMGYVTGPAGNTLTVYPSLSTTGTFPQQTALIINGNFTYKST